MIKLKDVLLSFGCGVLLYFLCLLYIHMPLHLAMLAVYSIVAITLILIAILLHNHRLITTLFRSTMIIVFYIIAFGVGIETKFHLYLASVFGDGDVVGLLLFLYLLLCLLTIFLITAIKSIVQIIKKFSTKG